MDNKRFFLGLFFLLLGILLIIREGIIYAGRMRIITIKNESRFLRLIKEKHDFAFVLFYENHKQAYQKSKDTAWYHNIKILQDICNDVSQKALYQDAGLVFAMINTWENDGSDIADQYNIIEVPSMMLFKFGYPVIDQETGQPVKLVGFVTEQDIHNFIKNYMAQDLHKTIEAKIEHKKERARQRKLCAPYMGYYPYSGYFGYPYYYYGFGWPYYYHSHPRIGVGVGFHL